VRRRRLREHLEELKKERAIKLEEAEKERIEKEKIEAEEKAEAERVRLLEEHRQLEIKSMMMEQRLMFHEDITMHELCACLNEHKLMEYEDIISFIVEHAIAEEEKLIDQRLQELEELYMPFNPDTSKILDHGKLYMRGSIDVFSLSVFRS